MSESKALDTSSRLKKVGATTLAGLVLTAGILSTGLSVDQANAQTITETSQTQEKTVESINMIHDEAKLFTLEEVNELNAFLESNYKSFGVVTAVATIEKLPAGQTMKSWTLSKANELGVGSATESNGLFFGISVKDREYYVAKGSGFKNVSESQLDSILTKNLVPAFKTENYAKGIKSSASAFGSYVKYHAEGDAAYYQALSDEATKKLKLFGYFLGGTLAAGGAAFLVFRYRDKKKDAKVELIKKNINEVSDREWEDYSVQPNHNARMNWLTSRRLYTKLLSIPDNSKVSDSDRNLVDTYISIMKYSSANPSTDESMKTAYERTLVELEEYEKQRKAREEAQRLWSEIPYSERTQFQNLNEQGKRDWLNNRYGNNSDYNSLFSPTNVLMFAAFVSLSDSHGSSSSSSSSSSSYSSSSYDSSSYGGGSFDSGSGGSW